MILILTHYGDQTADIVEALLRERGADILRVDNAKFTLDYGASASLAMGRDELSLISGGRRVNLSEITAGWDRRPEKCVAHPSVTDPRMQKYVASENQRFIDDFWCALACLWVPAIKPVVTRGQHKITQGQHARALGFTLPPTLFSNDPAEILDFYRANGGKIIAKPFYKNYVEPGEGRDEALGFRAYTQRVSHKDIGYIQSARYAPMIYQAEVPKRVELRITVVGEQVFAAEIDSQSSHRTRYDWRHYNVDRTPYRPHQLPAAEEARCLALTRRMGLCYGAIDMIVTPAGEYVFLEINPTGQWRWVEVLSGLPIADAMANLLMSRERAVAPATMEAL